MFAVCCYMADIRAQQIAENTVCDDRLKLPSPQLREGDIFTPFVCYISCEAQPKRNV